MPRISENLRTININEFIQTGNLFNDVNEFCKLSGKNPSSLPPGMPIVLALRLKLGSPLTVHVLTEAVCKKVLRVKIENLPTEYPAFLENPFFIEAKPGKVLFDNIDAIGGFIDENDEFYLVIWSDEGTHFTKTKTPFKGIRLDQIDYVQHPNSFPPPAGQNKNVFPFITILALMLEAEKTPIEIDHGTKKTRKRNQIQNKQKDQPDWIEKRIFIDAKFTLTAAKDTVPMDKTGMEKKEVHIQGFLRHQAHGPGHSLRKWIYIEDHSSTRWKKPGDRKITVDAYFD